jgi:hypothetical protein
MTTTELNPNEIERPAEPGSIGAGAEIYRRMERRSKGRPMWMTAAPIAVLALAAAGGVVAYEAMKPHATPVPVQAQATPAAAPQVAAATPTPAQPAQVAEVTPTPAAPAPVTRVVRPEHARPAIAAVAHKRTARDANAAASAGEDTSAFTPSPRHAVTAPPVAVSPGPAQPTAPVTHNFAPPSAAVTPAPAPITVSPPPPAATVAPAAPAPTGQP